MTSTPLGKPRNPIDLSTHVSHKANEGAVTEPPRSPYAPKQAHQRAGTEHHPVENDRDPLRSPYAAVTSDFVAGDDSGGFRRFARDETCGGIPRGSSQALNIVTKA
jgi:hypothetical protein